MNTMARTGSALPRLGKPDGWLLGGVLLLMLIGLLAIYTAGEQNLALLYRQGLRYLLAVLVMLMVAQLPPRLLRQSAPWFYLGVLGLLLLVVWFGRGAGAGRWLNLGVAQFQPAELSKLAVPMMVAWYLARNRVPPPLFALVPVALLIVVPCVLVAIQPDLGTAVMIAISGMVVLFLGGMHWRHIAAAGAVMLVTLPLMWSHLHEYQRERIRTFLDPESDPLGQGWNIIQSMTAVGSGGLLGKGWLQGTQSHLEFLPEPHTDFIMAVIAEEFGWLGVLAILGLYAAITARGLYIASQGRDAFARMLAGGLVMIFFLYALINMAMVAGLLPVVGVPLPLISYGGSSAVTVAAGFGILLSIYRHRKIWI